MGCLFLPSLQPDFWYVEQRSPGNSQLCLLEMPCLSGHPVVHSPDGCLKFCSHPYLFWPSYQPASESLRSLGSKLHPHSLQQHYFVHEPGQWPWMKKPVLWRSSCWIQQQSLGGPWTDWPCLRCGLAPISHSWCGSSWRTKLCQAVYVHGKVCCLKQPDMFRRGAPELEVGIPWFRRAHQPSNASG